ncbi:rRNA methyltransferase [Rhizobium sp. AC27/96]|uniref:rRNA methyltransferase n=1 Tax=Rhizobium sp. AC27/96 TaxID=1841653 RepID=UPI000839592B|nr:rRNA methyltransferase [Rhizobium sp. AC27/96]
MSNFHEVKVIQSSEGNVSKYVFTGETGVAESVLYRYPDYATRTVICCSTMSGCPVGCRFCGAGDYFVRGFRGEEIVEQVDRCIIDTGVDPAVMKRLQIMFMSMGEPLLNKSGMISALQALYGKYPRAALLISTIGPDIDYDWVEGISREIPTIGLQFSVHRSTDEERDELIPFKKKLSISLIARRGESWHATTGRKPFFNYCAGDDNSSDADAERLLNHFNPSVWNATVSVICERNEGMPARNDHQVELAANFASKLVERGFDVRVFDPAGQDDIGGGCGQLWFVQQWMRDHPEMARPSVGHGLPSIHTPRAVLV